MSDPFADLHDSLFASPLCVDATLRGAPVRAFVQHGVEMIGEYGQIVGRRTMVELASAGQPAQGDTVVIDSAPYLLDVLSADDGHVARWIVRVEP